MASFLSRARRLWPAFAAPARSATFSSSSSSSSATDNAAVAAVAAAATNAVAKAEAVKAPRSVPLASMLDSPLDGTSAAYVESLHEAWQEDRNSVHPSWTPLFEWLDYQPEMSQKGVGEIAEIHANLVDMLSPPRSAPEQLSVKGQTIQESMRLLLLVQRYQFLGHIHANLDPLGLWQRPHIPDLEPSLYGFTEDDMDREFFIGTWRMKGFLSEARPVTTLRHLLSRLRQTYCGTVGYEYMHIGHREQCNWFRSHVESAKPRQYSRARKIKILDRLMWSEEFEEFLASKFVAAKRFGLEGAEALIPGMKAMIDKAAELDMDCIVMGMPHRGRLNVLANVVRKPLKAIFNEFLGGKDMKLKEGEYSGSGDVKYHLGTSYERPTLSGKRIHLSLLANPSHLEAVDPVVLGKVRANQYFTNDPLREKTMGVLLHGDGSFSGQGIVMETLAMNQLPEYSTGGTIHIVVNNQVAFTTDPKFSRSSQYCTDVAKGYDFPILHVNGDDPEAVCHALEFAVEWKHAFKKDIVVDIVCYRRYGHNEIDEPMFTQPLLYRKIKEQQTSTELYQQKLIAEGVITQEEVDKMKSFTRGILNQEFDGAEDYVPGTKEWLSSHWEGFKSPAQLSRIRNTGISNATLLELGRKMTTIPENFKPHRGVKRVYEARAKMIESGEGIDWGTAEALAFATLLQEGNHVRVSGQDVERGTFSHRHALIHDQETGARYVPLDNLFEDQDDRQFVISNSNLSEFGILGFELGYSQSNPNCLVVWEAQFGDFSNGAQVIIDQFIASGEAKWLRQSGLVLLLPHGYDGQGPEHSSCRVERFLQMIDEDPREIPDMEESKRLQLQKCNMQVVNCTTPANYFHVLRRQIHREFRKPLIVVSPKNLLRHKNCKSSLDDFDDDLNTGDIQIQGARFKRLIYDRMYGKAEEPEVETVIFCSGKLYYELEEARRALETDHKVAITRIEQLAPFPHDLVTRELKRYANAKVRFVQEEPMNMGAWSYVEPRFRTIFKSLGRDCELEYIGRNPSAATATGFYKKHIAEQTQLINNALAK